MQSNLKVIRYVTTFLTVKMTTFTKTILLADSFLTENQSS